MSTVFVILFLISLLMLIWGLISPKSLSREGKKPVTRKDAGIGFGFFSVLFFILTGITAPAQNNSNANPPNSDTGPSYEQQIDTTSAQKTPEITKKAIKEKQPIAFDETTVETSSLAKGTSKITTFGVAGEKTLTYEVTYTDGKQTSKKLVKSEITKQPVAQITAVGTYVAPVTRSTVSSPTTTRSPSSDPVGATAKCRDGTYSYSQHRRGTCSWHGGVAVWL